MPHSPEVLRAFYLIAITKDCDLSDSLAERDRHGVVASDAAVSREGPLLPTLVGPSTQCEPAGHTTGAEVALATEGDIVDLGFDSGQAETGTSQVKSFLRNSLPARKGSACQQCRLWGVRCDLQKPSCWKCQQYFFPCYYEHDEANNMEGQDYRLIEAPINPEAEPVSWQDSVRAHPYHNLERKGKQYRIDRRSLLSRRGRLSKAIRRKQSASFDTKEDMKDDEEALLERSSPMTSEVDTGSRTPSPTGWLSSEPGHQFSRPISLCNSRYTISLADTESGTAVSSSRCSSTIWTTPPTSGDSSTWPPQSDDTPSDDAPRPFQCTFCLKQCNGQDEWESHELSQHIPKRIWICLPRGPVERTDGCDICAFCSAADPDADHCSQHNVQHCYDEKTVDQTFISREALQQHLSTVHNQTKMNHRTQKWWHLRKNDEWYWNCGFCDTLFPRWTDRVVHIGEHFNEGMVMSSWDPLTPPYPLDKTTLNCVAWFPPVDWDATTLWDLERKRCGFSWTRGPEQQYRCEYCDIDIYFAGEKDVKRHEGIWHSRREVWSCPTINDIKTGILAPYFFPIDKQAKLSDSDACPYCNNLFVKLTELYPGLGIWDVRVMHLEVDHDFNGCQPVCKSTNPSEVLLHLANMHNVSLSQLTFDVLESCRKEERPLAKMNMSSAKCYGRT